MTEGRSPAGPHVRDACARHLRDLSRVGSEDFPYTWDTGKVDRVCRFFSTTLQLDGGAEPIPFNPEPWQAFVLGSLFGWIGLDGWRRFRIAFVETGKGSGKSPLAAGIGLYMLMADGERMAEVYAAAVDKEQAGILFRDAVSMTKLSPAIDRRVTRSGGEGREYNIAFLETASFFRPISSESQGRGKSGYRPHCVLLDEIHEHPTNAMVEFMKAGTKNRRQALIFMITNSGVDRTSVCYEYHEHGSKVAAGEIADESFFSYICAVDEGEDPLEPEKYPLAWAKANPSLGVTVTEKYLADQVAGAKGMPSSESVIRRLNFCQWVDAANPWIDGDLWRACEVEPDQWDESEIVGLPCYLGLDLSARRDLTALAAVWPLANGYAAALWFWTPLDTMLERERKDRVPYTQWVTDGHLVGVPGRSIDYGYVAEHVAGLVGQYQVDGLAFDQWRIEDFDRAMRDVGLDSYLWEGPDAMPGTGIRMVRHGQGTGGGSSAKALWMPRSITTLEDAILRGELRVKANPVLRWNSASAVLEQDRSGNKTWEKRKSTGRIDGIVALSMALGLAASEPDASISDYGGSGVIAF